MRGGAACRAAVLDTAASPQLDLQFGLCDDSEKSPLKTVNPICIIYGNSLHFLSFQLLSVKSDNICKLAPEIKAETVFSAWFQAHLLTSIAEEPGRTIDLNFGHAFAIGGSLLDSESRAIDGIKVNRKERVLLVDRDCIIADCEWAKRNALKQGAADLLSCRESAGLCSLIVAQKCTIVNCNV